MTGSLEAIADITGLWPGDGPDGWFGIAMSGLAGAAAALAIAVLLMIYFQTGYRSRRDMVRHGLAAAFLLGLLAFATYDMRHAALAYLGIAPSKPSAELEMRLVDTDAPSINKSGEDFEDLAA